MPTLVFVYNADHGFFNALTDSIHKLVSPRTYRCALCALTHGPVAMRDEWRRFVESLDLPVEFLHRDELASLVGRAEVELPAVFVRPHSGPLQPWIDAASINAVTSLDALKALITERLKTLPEDG